MKVYDITLYHTYPINMKIIRNLPHKCTTPQRPFAYDCASATAFVVQAYMCSRLSGTSTFETTRGHIRCSRVLTLNTCVQQARRTCQKLLRIVTFFVFVVVFFSTSALLPQWFLTASAVVPHCFRSGSSLLPQWFCTSSAVVLHYFRTTSALLFFR